MTQGRRLTPEQIRLAESCDRLARNLAQKYHAKNPFISFDDLYQEACLGLYDAAGKYDPDKGTKFTTIAYMYIRKYVLRFIENNIVSGPKPPRLEVQQYLYDKDISVEDFNRFTETFVNPHCIDEYSEGIIEDSADVNNKQFVWYLLQAAETLLDDAESLVFIDVVNRIAQDEQDPWKRAGELLGVGEDQARMMFEQAARKVLGAIKGD